LNAHWSRLKQDICLLPTNLDILWSPVKAGYLFTSNQSEYTLSPGWSWISVYYQSTWIYPEARFNRISVYYQSTWIYTGARFNRISVYYQSTWIYTGARFNRISVYYQSTWTYTGARFMLNICLLETQPDIPWSQVRAGYLFSTNLSGYSLVP